MTIDADQRVAAITYGEAMNINPYRALLDEVYRTSGHVAWLGERVRTSNADDLTNPRSAASRWRRMYVEEREMLVRASEKCISLGLAERQVRLAEQQGELVAQLLLACADELSLTESQRALLPTVLEAKLAALPGLGE